MNSKDKHTLDRLFKRKSIYRTSEAFIKFIDRISRSSHYSRYNNMLVYAQNMAVKFFGGESFWEKKYNRTIKEDARPYVIITLGGPVMMVYDINDTDGILTSEEVLEKILEVKHSEAQDIFIDFLLKGVINTLRQWGIEVKEKPLTYIDGGFAIRTIAGKFKISLQQELSSAEKLAVLMHALAHLFLGHTGHKELSNIENSKTKKLLFRDISNSAKELEAESVSYLLLKGLELENRSAEYIAEYIKDEKLLMDINYELIIKVADKIDSLFLNKAKIEAKNSKKIAKETLKRKAQAVRNGLNNYEV